MWLCLLGFLLVIQGLVAENTLSTDNAYTLKACILKLMECNEQKMQLSPFKVNGNVLFNRYPDLDKSCSLGKNFFSCMKETEELCKELPLVSDTIFQNRQFAKSICTEEGSWRKWYMDNEYCINFYSPYILDRCARSAIKNISGQYERGTSAFTCRYDAEVRSCRILLTQNYCGIVAGKVLQKVLMYHREYELMCAYMDKYDSIELPPIGVNLAEIEGNMEPETGNIDLHRTGNILNYETSTSNSENIPNSTELRNIEPDKLESATQENVFTTESFYSYKNPSESDDALLDTQYAFIQKSSRSEESFTPDASANENETSVQDEERFTFDVSGNSHYTFKSNDDISSPNLEENCSNFTTFGLYEILDQGVRYYLGCGFAMISPTTNSPLKNIYCTWSSEADQEQMFKCSVHIAEACLFEEKCHYPSCTVFDLAYETDLFIYELDNEIYQKKATIKMKYYKPNTNAFPPGDISLYTYHPNPDKFENDHRQWKFSVTQNY